MDKFFTYLRRFLEESKKRHSALLERYKIYKKSKDRTLFDKKLVFSLSPKKFPNIEQFKMLDKVLSPKERAAMIIFTLIIIVSSFFLLRSFYQKHRTYKPAYGGVYIEGLIGSPRFINPLYSSTNDVDTDISRLLFDGLLKNDPDEGLIPGLADSYIVSADQKTYTFYLRDDIKWHDDIPIRADDVVFTIKAIQNSEYASPLARSFAGVDVEKVDDLTVKFVLEEEFPAFLNALTNGIIPEHVWMDISPFAAKLSEFNLRPIGSGPFRFKSFVREKGGGILSYTLVSNDEYFEKPPYIKTATFKFYPNLEIAADALYRNEVDGLSFFSKSLSDKKRNDATYYSLNLPQYTAIFFNLNNDFLKDRNLRQSLAQAINREKILIEALGGEGLIADAPVPKGFLGYHPEIKRYSFDTELVQENLEKFGWKADQDTGYRKKGETLLEITLTAPDLKEYINVAEIVKENWEDVGVKTNLQIIPTSQIVQNTIKPRAYDALIYGEIISAGLDLYPFWHSTQAEDPGLNLSIFQNRDADRLLERIRTIRKREDREKDLISFQNILAKELPAIFLYNPIYTYPVTNRVKGIDVQKINNPSDRFSNITDWYIKEKVGWKW
ncbi:MAG: ABC transporter substrate-binding protein [Patescibacteria group bacterium]|nr:ABC transporter substrate-binding protein [Patescibacteria group bacterium]